jgi:hypothetical protein
VQTSGLFWSHALGSANASPRDGTENKELRETYAMVHTPFFRNVGLPRFPGAICGPACKLWVDPRIWEIYPFPRDDTNPRIPANPFREISRRWPTGSGGEFQNGTGIFDLIDRLPVDVRGELGNPNRDFPPPVESTPDRVSQRLPTVFASVESPWTGTVPITEVVAAPRGRVERGAVAPLAPVVPGPRSGARALLSASERTVYLVGGTRVLPGGTTQPTNEIWTNNLDTGEWRRVGAEGRVGGAGLREIAAAGYDPLQRQLYVLGTTTNTSPVAVSGALRLTSIDTRSGVARSLGSFPTLFGPKQVSVVVTAKHTLVLARQKDAQTVQLYELDTSGSKPTVVGYATVLGALDGELFAPDDVYVPVVKNGSPKIQRVSAATLTQKTGLSQAGDGDQDGVLDVLDDCPQSFNPTQAGCADVSQAVLYASSKLTLADRVETLGANALLVSAGTFATSIGVDAKIGSLQSKAPVTLRDRARASGSVMSSGLVTRLNGAGASGGVFSNVSLALNGLSSFNVTFPAAGPPSLSSRICASPWLPGPTEP